MMRRLAFFVIALLLGLPACAPRVAEMGPAIATPAFTDNAFRTRDSLALGLQSWEAKAPKAVIVALHGMNDYANAFAMPGAWLAERGVTTYAYDQRGFGRSPNPGLWAGEDALAADACDAVAFARSRHPGVPVFLLGESMGGAVAIAAMMDAEPAQADGVILVAPAVWGWSSLPWSYQATLWIGAHTVPWAEVRPPRGLKISPSDNIEMLRALARDPRRARDREHRRLQQRLGPRVRRALAGRGRGHVRGEARRRRRGPLPRARRPGGRGPRRPPGRGRAGRSRAGPPVTSAGCRREE